MPSLVRFLTIVGTILAVIYGGLYVLATRFEPEQQEVTRAVPGVKIRKDAVPAEAPAASPTTVPGP